MSCSLTWRFPCARADVELQKKLHPKLATLELKADAATVFETAVELCNELYGDVLSDSSKMVVEAVDTTKLMKFKDDVAIRITSVAERGMCRVDMRSASRTGKSDLGKNAARVTVFFQQLRSRIEKKGTK